MPDTVDIVSPQNPLIKRVQSLRQRKYRRREGCFWAEGIRVVLEARPVSNTSAGF